MAKGHDVLRLRHIRPLSRETSDGCKRAPEPFRSRAHLRRAACPAPITNHLSEMVRQPCVHVANNLHRLLDAAHSHPPLRTVTHQPPLISPPCQRSGRNRLYFCYDCLRPFTSTPEVALPFGHLYMCVGLRQAGPAQAAPRVSCGNRRLQQPLDSSLQLTSVAG